MKLRSHTIGTKLLLAFSASTGLIAVVMAVSWGTWSLLDKQVGDLLKDNVPKYNASYQVESSSSQIRSAIDFAPQIESKSILEDYMQSLQSELTTIESILATLTRNGETDSLLAGYQVLSQQIQTFGEMLLEHIDKERTLSLLNGEIRWIHQDIGSELRPLRQEIEWQLEKEKRHGLVEKLLANMRVIHSINDQEQALYELLLDVSDSAHVSQVDNGMKVVQYRLGDLENVSTALYLLPSAISYQQLIETMGELLRFDGEFHSAVKTFVTSKNRIQKQQKTILTQLDLLHRNVASLASTADAEFAQVKLDTAQLVSSGNRVLVICFSLSIVISLLLTYYFVNRRIVSRLIALSETLDAMTENQSDIAFPVDGKDEIARVSHKLKQYYQAMREMEKTNALNLINNAHSSLITCDMSGTIESANLSARSLFNLSDNALNSKLWVWVSVEEQGLMKRVFARDSSLISSGESCITLCFNRADSICYLQFYFSVYKQSGVPKVMVTVTDITEQTQANLILEERVSEKTRDLVMANLELQAEVEERRKAETHLKETQSELIQAAKMAVVGQTMSSMAHELNQPLSAINTYLFSAKIALGSNNDEEVESSIEQIKAMTERMSKIINSLRHFAKKQPKDTSLEYVGILDAIQRAGVLVETRLRKIQCRLTWHVSESENVWAESVGLEQVLVNLLVNSLDAVAEVDHREVEIFTQRETDGITRLCISDSGMGFSHSVINQIFTPFTTTKEVGLGLGLNICRSIVKQFNGDILLASSLSGGACVVLELPNDPQ
ncbi:putative TWO COMPONENT HISTIDINE KINASE [Vibrio nigripulchritudo SO65]|uniref:ATP-binding protein n=1 Tax=Vibrio nigripulchritudo TaxID=28173 RepID=UPI0003B18F1F|nr:ATP-binding protein [Vibrio nigripulchritudo]CCN32920.1 putative TWO COMPONENT HISTIDINE KINASE [Vibrio nigripulchritudo AM115]CCN40393.1 putative TWO COMPONENT HISTIDINE KINASE [Vibrio nigripulchritudo FTn2]CCN65274.1 putative TWO COMPONENT HISTIDINE KINASE [Vibrio nigripulchritudo POn4]CCN77249.1 putative TWO COMPONENT HISTIDINE KINASE [Vibrio nigripulchritudo SO65]